MLLRIFNVIGCTKVKPRSAILAIFSLAAIATTAFLIGKSSLSPVPVYKASPVYRLPDPDVIYFDATKKCPGSYSFEERIKRPVTRAIVAYYPVKQEFPYLGQLKWCMRSILEMMKTEPPTWRTDVILFVENATVGPLLDLGCTTEKRSNLSEPFKCVLVPYVRVKDRVLTPNSTQYDKEIKEQMADYSYIDSMAPLAELKETYTHYDVIIRSDLDVFFTPAFSTWVPPGCTFVTGHGGYQSNYNIEKMVRIANATGHYFNSSIWNIGSTWIGPAPIVADVAKQTVHWMVELSKNEFAPPMRQAKFWLKAELWPDWHYGVLLLYGGQMAVNEVTQAGKRYPFHKVELDHPSTSKATCNTTGPIHLHTYQSDDYFSKIAFADKKYKEHDLPRFLNSSLCRDYAGYIAQDSLNMTSQMLAGLLKNAKGR